MYGTAPLAYGDLQTIQPTSSPGAVVGETRTSLSVVDGVDGYTRSVAGVQVEAVRSGLGTGPNRVLTVHDEGLMFTSSDIGFPLRTRTTVGDDHVIVGCVLAAPPGSRWCEFDLRPGTVVAYGSGAEHTGVSLPGLRFEFATVTADRLGECADRIGSPLELPNRGEVRDLTSAPIAPEIFSSMPELAAAAARGRASLPRAEDAVLVAVVRALTETDHAMPAHRRRGIDSRHVVHQCMDYVDATGRIPSISELCLAAHVSERKLRQAFIDEFDVPPTRFFREWALTMARQRLRTAGDDGRTVSEIAFDLGFAHLGRFAIFYRELYDETPSTTLRTSLVEASNRITNAVTEPPTS